MKSCFNLIVFCYCFCCFLGDFTGVVLIGSEQAKVNPHNVSQFGQSSGRTKNGNKGVPSREYGTKNKGFQSQGVDASNDNGFRSQPDDLANNDGVRSQPVRAENNRFQSQRSDVKGDDGFGRSQRARGNRNIRETFRSQRPESNGFQSPRGIMNNDVLPSAFANRIEQQPRSINNGLQSQRRGTKNNGYNSQQSGGNSNRYNAQRPNGNSNNGYRAQRSNTNNNRFQSQRPGANTNAHQSQRSTGNTNQAQSQRRNSNNDRFQAQRHSSNNQGFQPQRQSSFNNGFQAQRQNGNSNGFQAQRHGGNNGRFQGQRQNIHNNGFQAQLQNGNKNNGYPQHTGNSNGYSSQQPQRNSNRFQSQRPHRNSGFQSSGNNNRYQSQRSNANNNNGHQSRQPNANYNAFQQGQTNRNDNGLQLRQPGMSSSGFQLQQSRGNSNRFQAQRPVQRQLVGRNNNRYRENNNRMRTRQTDAYDDGFGTNQLVDKTSSFGSSRNNGFRTKHHDSGNKGFSPSGFAPNNRSMRPGTYSAFSSSVHGNQFNNVNIKGFRRKQGPGRGLFSSVTDEPPLLDYFSYHDPRIDWDALFQMEESNSAVLLRLIHLIGFASVNAGTAVSLYQEWYEGDGTYFDSKGEGSCQISTTDPLPPAAQNADFMAALNVEQYLSSAACGMCFRVQGDGKGRGLTPINGDYIVYVQDLCPSCKAGDMDLMAVNGDGRWDIRIKAVQCPVGNTAIQYWFQGSNAWYIKLQVRNTRVPCKEIHVQARTGQWKELNLTRDGHWAGSARLNLGGDVAVRLTSINGAVLEDIIPRLENHVVMEGKLRVQFPLDSSLPDA